MPHSRVGSWRSNGHLKGVDAANVASVVDDRSGADRRSLEQMGTVKARNFYRSGWLSRVDLLVLTSSYQLILKLKNSFFFVTKQAVLMRRSIVLSLSLWLVE